MARLKEKETTRKPTKGKKENRKVLVLDANYQAIQVIDWKDAICLVYLDKAEAVTYYEDFSVRSVSQELQVPSILRVKNKFKANYKKMNISRMKIFKRDKFQCAYCGDHFTKKELTIDHIIPLSRGGAKKTWENLITSCGGCNYKKADKLPREANMPLLFEPYIPKWSPKLALSLSFSYPSEWEDWLY